MNLLASMRYLVALEEHRHFGRAAQACHITQPALSNALRALEDEFGAVIVRRGRTYVGLTAEGETVLAAARRMLHEHKLLEQELASTLDRPQGQLRLAAVPTAMPILSGFAALLRASHPGIVPVVLSMSSHELETGLEQLALDLALGYTERMSLPGVRLTAWPQYDEHYFFVRRRGDAAGFRIGEPVDWAQAAREPLCLLTPDMHNRAIIDQAFVDAGRPVQPAIETNSVLTLVQAIGPGQVSGVLPGAMVATLRNDPGLLARPLQSPHVTTPIGFMAPAGVRASRALEAALTLLQTSAWQAYAAAHSGRLTA